MEDKIIILTMDDDHLLYFPANRLYSMAIAFEGDKISRVDLSLKDMNNLDIETHTGKSADFISIDSLCSVLDDEKSSQVKRIGF